MSIAGAVNEILSISRTPEQRRQASFRAQQQELDQLIGAVESLVSHDIQEVPQALRDRAERSIAAVHGKAIPWLDRVTTPSSMLDQLFIAEGRLRQRYYVGVDLELEDSA